MSDEGSSDESDENGGIGDRHADRAAPLVLRLDQWVELDGGLNPSDSSSDEEENEGNPEELQAFDVHVPASHSYLFDGEEADVTNSGWLDPSKSHLVPLITLDIVVLPGQMVPFQTGYPEARYAILTAVRDQTYLGVVMASHSEPGSYGTLLQITKVASDEMMIKANMIGRQRFRLLTKERCINGMMMGGVEVLTEFMLPTFTQAFCPNSALKLTEKRKSRMCSSIINIPTFAALSCSTTKNCEALAGWMKLWYCEEKIKCSLDLGPTVFGYWVASHLPVSLAAKYEILSENSTDIRIANLLHIVHTLTDLVCKSCDTVISSIRNIVNMNSEGTSSHFVNNAGYIHEMVTVSEANNNIALRGRPQSNFSWFKGYKWQIMECSVCASHLGWEFTSRIFSPAKFYGITRQAVTPSAEAQPDM